MKQLWRVRFRIGLIYWPRLFCALSLSTLATALTLPERLGAPFLLRRRSAAPDPLFIVGLPRTGTTHLHNLLALDPLMVAPRLYQVLCPHGSMFTAWLLVPLLGFVPPRRPMDGVRLHAFSASEEEIALANMTYLSPYWGFVFPQKEEFFRQYADPDGMRVLERGQWEKCYLEFVQRVTFFSKKRPVLKNPVNTSRLSSLVRLFPGSKFIHLRRNPLAVFQSTQHLLENGAVLWQLQDQSPLTETRFIQSYRDAESAFERDRALLSKRQIADIKFEDLETNPVAEIERAYDQLELSLSTTFRTKLIGYLGGLTTYKKNVFRPLKDNQRRRLQNELRAYFELGGYA